MARSLFVVAVLQAAIAFSRNSFGAAGVVTVVRREDLTGLDKPGDKAAAHEHEKEKSFFLARWWSALLQQDLETALKNEEGPERAPVQMHVMFDFDWSYMRHWNVYVCAVVLFLAGLLCSAGGIGGGGIYVTVLMIFGGLQVEQAVPLSKSVVFFGACASMVLNMRKNLVMGRSESQNTLIDFNICRLVVPSSLLGTFMGVYLFHILPKWMLLTLLTLILVFISVTVTRQCLHQRFEEQALEQQNVHSQLSRSAESCGGDRGGGFGASVHASLGGGGGGGGPAAEQQSLVLPTSIRNSVCAQDICIAVGMEFVVVLSSVFIFQLEQCSTPADFSGRLANQVCERPLLFFLSSHTLKAIADNSSTGSLLQGIAFMIPFSVCTVVLMYYSYVLVNREGWCYIDTLKFDCMAVMTGCLAGLVGIGGGLIFAPFFLLMGMEPAIAVATSSTCVLFTSSSTTLQYFLTDRIIASLTVVFGIVSLMASYQGTSFVHLLQDKFQARRSYITSIVLVGVMISTVLSAVKLFEQVDPAA